MNKESYKLKARIGHIRVKNKELSLRSANAVIKLMKALGPLSKEKRRRLLKAATILIGFEP